VEGYPAGGTKRAAVLVRFRPRLRLSVAEERITSEPTQRETLLRLLGEYRGALERLAGAYVRDAHDREDLVQEIAMALWRAIPGFRGEASERTWLYRIAHNTAIRSAARLRRRGWREGEALEELPAQPPTDELSAEARLIEAQRRDWLLGALRAMAPLDRQVVSLYLEGLEQRAIGEVTGLSEGAVATRLSRIRARLARQNEARVG
jgi:RNA polymerase sigma-70 factor, ECF subfamily